MLRSVTALLLLLAGTASAQTPATRLKADQVQMTPVAAPTCAAGKTCLWMSSAQALTIRKANGTDTTLGAGGASSTEFATSTSGAVAVTPNRGGIGYLAQTNSVSSISIGAGQATDLFTLLIVGDGHTGPSSITNALLHNSALLWPLNGQTFALQLQYSSSLGKWVQLGTTSTVTPATAVYGILQTGQSLAVGYPGDTIIGSTAVPGYRFTGGITEIHQTTPWAVVDTSSLVSLTEALVTNDGFSLGESGLHSAAKIITASTGRNYVVASVGTQSLGLSSRNKTAGNNIYTNTIAVVSAMRARVEAAGLVFGGVAMIIEVGGETDATDASYYSNLLQYQSDLSTDIIAVTGQSSPSPIPMVLSQTVANAAFVTNDSSHSMVVAARTYPTRFVLSVNKSILDNYTPNTGHLLPTGYRAMGAYNGLAYLNWLANGTSLVPMPDLTSVSRSGQTYTVDFIVPSPPLVLDTSYVSQQASPQLYGFEVLTSGFSFVTVDSVTVGSGPNGAGTRATVHVASSPGSNSYFRYAVGISGDGRTTQLPTTGPRGNLRDSSTLLDAEGAALLGNYVPRFQVQLSN